jgi:hypothetical protein
MGAVSPRCKRKIKVETSSMSRLAPGIRSRGFFGNREFETGAL